MKLQFKLRNGDILDVKRAFVFRLNFDKEYLFYTTDTFKDGDMVPVIFGEMIGPSVIKVAPEEREMFEKFLFALANNQVDNISNYELVNYKQLDVTILSAQKTKLPAYILNKYSSNFEVVLPPKYDVIDDPTPEIIPAIPEIKENVIGTINDTSNEKNDNLESKHEDKVVIKKEEIKNDNNAFYNNFTFLENDAHDFKFIPNEEEIPTEIANKVFEQLVNSNPVEEVMDTLEPLPLKINREASKYEPENNFPYANTNFPKPVIENKAPEIKNDKVSKKNNIVQIILIAVLAAGVIYFGYNWVMQTYFKKDIDNLVDSKTLTVLCETHPTTENNYRTTSRINGKFINEFLTEYIETKTMEFSTVEEYNAYKEAHINDVLTNNAGYYESVEYLDESLTVYKEIKIIKDDMSLNDWVSYLGEDTTYTYLLGKYHNNGYVCGTEA